MKIGIANTFLFTVFIATTLAAPIVPRVDYGNIIDAITDASAHHYPILPRPSSTLRGNAANEVIADPEIRTAMAALNPQMGNRFLFESRVATLKKKKAVSCLQIALCHPESGVQIAALRALGELKDPSTVHFILIYAEYMAISIGGSEEATIYGLLHIAISQTLSEITGVKVSIRSQDPEELSRGILQWEKWDVERRAKIGER